MRRITYDIISGEDPGIFDREGGGRGGGSPNFIQHVETANNFYATSKSVILQHIPWLQLLRLFNVKRDTSRGFCGFLTQTILKSVVANLTHSEY